VGDSLNAIANRLCDLLATNAKASLVAGAVVGVDLGGEQIVLPYGIANLNTGHPFTDDTGWLLGSVTKVLTTSVLMRPVERERGDLNARAIRYVPSSRSTTQMPPARLRCGCSSTTRTASTPTR
jgi:CubicO group peptidase (beta-lactamase class C family)